MCWHNACCLCPSVGVSKTCPGDVQISKKVLLAKLTSSLSEKLTQQLSRFGVVTVAPQLETDIRDVVAKQLCELITLSLQPELAVRTLADIREKDPHLLILVIGGGEDSEECSPLAVRSPESGIGRRVSPNARTQAVLDHLGVTRTDCGVSALTGGENMIGSSATIVRVRTLVANVARTECNVLLTGETGTGKELVADLIHKNGTRMGKPFIKVNCAAIPDSLLESELFGYERGAFTGAHSRTQGKLEQANTGTILFDEIGDMSPYAQAKVLRSIESGEITRLGGRAPTSWTFGYLPQQIVIWNQWPWRITLEKISTFDSTWLGFICHRYETGRLTSRQLPIITLIILMLHLELK